METTITADYHKKELITREVGGVNMWAHFTIHDLKIQDIRLKYSILKGEGYSESLYKVEIKTLRV